MPKDYETSIFEKRQVKSARIKGQVRGWAQGAGAILVVFLLLKLFGWIPAVLLMAVIVVAGWGVSRAIRRLGDRD